MRGVLFRPRNKIKSFINSKEKCLLNQRSHLINIEKICKFLMLKISSQECTYPKNEIVVNRQRTINIYILSFKIKTETKNKP